MASELEQREMKLLSISLLSSGSGSGIGMSLSFWIWISTSTEFRGYSKDRNKNEDIPDKKFIQDVCWCCLATGELIILRITCEMTTTEQVIECMTNLQVFDPCSWLWYVCLSATSLAASWRTERSITKRIYFSLGRGNQMSELPCVSLSLLPFIVQKITPCFMTRPTDLKLKKQITAQL